MSDSPGVVFSLMGNVDRVRERIRSLADDPDLPQRVRILGDSAVWNEGKYVSVLGEARSVFVLGQYFAVVALTGISCERILKDVLRLSLLVRLGDDEPKKPSEEAFDQLEKAEAGALAKFLWKAGLITEAAWRAADKLAQLRNAYTHGRFGEPRSDAEKAISLLKEFVEETVSAWSSLKIEGGPPLSEGPG